MEEQEIWKDVVGYEGLYQVSNLGRVKSLPKKKLTPTSTFYSKEKIANQHIGRKGYARVSLTKDGKTKLFFIHRLVARTFIGEGFGMTVNHKDENKLNNRVCNLEYMSLRDNVKYGTGIQRSAKSRKESEKVGIPVNQYTLDGVFIARYKSGTNALAKLCIKSKPCYIMDCCRRKRNTAFGYVWRFDGDEDATFTKGSNSRQVIQFDLNGNYIKEYKSMREASIICGLQHGHICSCCRGERKQTGGFTWKYKEG